MHENMNTDIPFHPSDIRTFRSLHTAISETRDDGSVLITLLGSAKTQPPEIQRLVHDYMGQIEPYSDKALFAIGGRGEQGSVMDLSVEECFQRRLRAFVVGIKPVFDLGGRIPRERVFAFGNISLRCYAISQLSDMLIVFPGGIGTIQEIIVPLMHRKLDTPLSSELQGPRAIFIATDQANPVTDFLPLLLDRQFVSDEKSIPLFPVTVGNFSEHLARHMASE